jgi:hypothetical protein
VAVVGGVSAVNVASATTIVKLGDAVSTEPSASTTNVLVPADVGLPDNTPVVSSRVSPSGSDPDTTENVGVGVPVATNV